MDPRPLLIGVYNNQGLQCYLWMRQSKGAKCKELEKIVVSNDSEKFFQVRAQLPPREKEELIDFLIRNIDVFTWNAYKAPGVSFAII